MSLLFNDIVAVVTGAGGGLGKAYALELAKRGASLVINDLGGLRNGEGKNSSAADSVVDQIRKFGGNAVANYDSVENGDRVVNDALKNFGKIDILINNAGILRDKSFSKIDDEDWNKVINIHLNGAYKATRAAWNHMKSQNHGRIIFTSSASGIYGNFGQSNYSSAKSALIGLMKTLSIEGFKHDILCNAIAPVAGSRMTEDVFPPDIFQLLKPEYVTPLVVYLCHKNCQETGSLFEIGAGWIGKVRVEVNKGLTFDPNDGKYTPEKIEELWEKISDFSESSHPKSIKESLENLLNSISSAKDQINTSDIKSLSDVIGKSIQGNIKPFCSKDAIMYALSLGVSSEDEKNMKYLYENHEEFTVLPTFAMIPSLNAALDLMRILMDNPDLEISMTQILHGEQSLNNFKQFPLNESLKYSAKIVDIVDKIKGTLIIVNVDIFEKFDEKISTAQVVIYVNNLKGKVKSRNSLKIVPLKPIPNHKPDLVIEKKIDINQAIFYRLNGDFNPLHIDKDIAQISGYEKPILHGLCLYGIVGYTILKEVFNNDLKQFGEFKVRFSKPVTPGETVSIEIWKSDNFIQVQVKEGDKICLSGAYVSIVKSGIPTPVYAKL